MRGTSPKAAIVLLLAAVLAMPAHAPAAKPKRASTFSGSCDLTGTVAFSPPLTGSPTATRSTAEASGPCTGTWRTRNRTWTLDGDFVTYHAIASGTQSCAQGEATGTGYLRYRGRRLGFTLEESRIAIAADLQISGNRGGAMSGTATAEGDPAAAVQSCLASGIGEAAISGTVTTDPEISG
jgi:hypothetical protein